MQATLNNPASLLNDNVRTTGSQTTEILRRLRLTGCLHRGQSELVLLQVQEISSRSPSSATSTGPTARLPISGAGSTASLWNPASLSCPSSSTSICSAYPICSATATNRIPGLRANTAGACTTYPGLPASTSKRGDGEGQGP